MTLACRTGSMQRGRQLAEMLDGPGGKLICEHFGVRIHSVVRLLANEARRARDGRTKSAFDVDRLIRPSAPKLGQRTMESRRRRDRCQIVCGPSLISAVPTRLDRPDARRVNSPPGGCPRNDPRFKFLTITHF